MSGADETSGKKLVPHAGYEVGYGKPPMETRFKKGQSGNPRGRPKGAKNKRPGLHEERLKDIILDEAYRGIAVREGERMVTIPMAQAIIRSMAVNAAKGQHRAQRLFSELLATTETSRRVLHDEWLNTAIAYKVDWEKELRRREVLGITDLPEPLPHPDHVHIDLRQGTARIVGPATPEEKAEWDEMVEMKQALMVALPDLYPPLETTTDPEELLELKSHIERCEENLEMLRQVIPD